MAAVSTARSSSVPQFNLTGPPSIHRKTKDASKEVPGKAFMDLMVANFNKKPTDDSKEIPGKAFMDLMVANFNKVSRTPPSPPPVRGFTENYGSANTLNLGSSIEVVDRSESTHHTYNVYFNNEKIHTTVTHTASVVDEWIQDVYTDFHSKLNKLVVGLDVEWSRIRDINGIRNKVAVLQLCLSRRCLIFQISWCDKIPESLYLFLSCEKYLFVGSGIDGDAQKLWVDHRLSVARTEELGSLAAYKLTRSDEGYRESPLCNAGLKTLARAVLNLELPKQKAIQLSNWQNGLLSDEQIEYACLDAFVSFKLAIHLMNRVNPVHGAEPKRFWKDFSEPKKVVDETAKQVAAKTNEPTKPVAAKPVASKTNEPTKPVAAKQVAAKTNEPTKPVAAKTNEAIKPVAAKTNEATKQVPNKTAEALKHLFAETEEAPKQVLAKAIEAKATKQVSAKTIEAKATRTNEATKQDLAKTIEAMKKIFAEESTKKIAAARIEATKKIAAARTEATKQVSAETVSAETNESKATKQVFAKTNEVTKQGSEKANGFKTNEVAKRVAAKSDEAIKQILEAHGFKTIGATKQVSAKSAESTKQVSEKAIGSKTDEATKQVYEKADEASKQMSESEKAIGSKADEATKQISEKPIESKTDEATQQVPETEHDFEMVDEYNTPSPPSAGEGWSWTWRSLLRK